MSSAPENPAPASMRSETGYIGSFLVHLAIVGVALLLSRITPAPPEVEAHDPLLLEVWAGDGSERAPGIPGRDRGIAEGVVTGDKSKTTPGGMKRVRSLNADKLLKTLKDNEAAAAREAAANEAKAKAESAKPDAKMTKTSAKTETLDAFNKATGKNAKPGKTSSTSSKATGSGKAGITGASVGSGTGKGSGADAFGRAGGKGKNGGDGGSGEAMKLFIGDVRGKFADIFIPLFREQGGDLESTRDRGEVKIAVSASGLVSFAGWAVRPTDPLVERLVVESIQKMRPVRTPPGGEPITVIIPVSGSVDE